MELIKVCLIVVLLVSFTAGQAIAELTRTKNDMSTKIERNSIKEMVKKGAEEKREEAIRRDLEHLKRLKGGNSIIKNYAFKRFHFI